MTRRTLPAPFDDMCERYGIKPSSYTLIRELKQKREQRSELGRQIIQRAGSKLTGAQEREIDRLLEERDDLDEMVTQAEERLEGVRNQPFEGQGGRGREDAPGLTFQTAEGRTIRGVRHGESFAAAVHKPRAPRPGADGDEQDLSVGRALLGFLRGDHDLMERELRAQVVASDPSGGFFVTDSLASMFIDKARSQSVISQAGAITVPLTGGETRILRVVTDPTAAWKAEGAGLNETEIKFGAVVMYPKVLGCIAELSEELVQDGANAADVIQTTLAAAVANQLDRSFWRGISNGSGDSDVPGRNTFTGVLDDPDVNTVDMAGAAPSDYDEWIDAMQLVEDANGMANVRIDSPRTAGQLAKLKETGTGAYLKAPEAVAALRHLRTTQTPVTLGAGNDESVSVVGNFSTAYVILGMRTQFSIQVSNQAGDAFENLTRKVRIWGRADMVIGRPSHLSLIQAIGPTS
ncbi:phage major capsid protein [Streptomyces sp. B1-3]|uniref:phage major capsid protein n=1 Tax=Streptomyces sp. B1-3 TaxID=3141453 RepID=UPI003D26E7F4